MPLLLPLSHLLVSLPIRTLTLIQFLFPHPSFHFTPVTTLSSRTTAQLIVILVLRLLKWPSFLLSPTPLFSGHTFGVCTTFSMQISNIPFAEIWIQFKQTSRGVVCRKLLFVDIGRRWTFKKWSLVRGSLVPKGAASRRH